MGVSIDTNSSIAEGNQVSTHAGLEYEIVGDKPCDPALANRPGDSPWHGPAGVAD